ncbi:hypothetical protein Hanom_Chr08g00751601 [Helianthus anomalus]
MCSALQGLQHLLDHYTESCEAVKVVEAKIKKAKITISDRGKISDAKTQYYEDKLKKVSQDAEIKLAAVLVKNLIKDNVTKL